MSDESIFAAALDKAPGADRRAFLDEACGDDGALRQRVERLLDADRQAGGILERSPDAGATDALDGPPLLPERVFAGRFKLRQKLGEGGMGEVWVADQVEPVHRRVAVKVVRPGLDSERMLARFDQERQALALMDHPNIAKVLDAGEADGRPYFVMELIKGVPITEYCDKARLSPRERLALFVPVCEAVQHAHQKGVVHRDLKPSNILVALYDGRPVPKVIDFGIAKATGPRLTDRSIYTEVGALVGTLEYMAPEQAELNNLDIDTRADVYALGAILYELLTGSVPFSRQELQAAGFLEMLRVIREVEPPRPSTKLSKSGTLPNVADVRRTDPQKLVSLMRGELDWIILKCLEKDRGRRYQAASGLARDLEHYLADEPVEACPPTAGYRLRKFARKHRTALVTAAAFAILLVAGMVVSTWQAIRATVAEQAARSSARAAGLSEQVAQKRKDEAEEAKQLAEQRRDELAAVNDTLRRANYVADMNLARVAWDENSLTRAHELLEKHRPQPGETDRRGFEWHYLRRLFQSDLLTVKAHPGEVTAVAFMPDGKRLVTSGLSRPWLTLFDPRPGEVKLWDAATGQPLRIKLSGQVDKVVRVALSPDGTHLAATHSNHTVLVWDLATGGLVTLEGPATQVAGRLGFSPDGKRLACTYSPVDDDPINDSSRSIRIWDLATRQAVVTIDRLPISIRAPHFSPDGRLLVAAAWSMALVKVWDAATGREAFSCDFTDGGIVREAAFSPDGKRLAACADKAIRIWDVASRATQATWPFGSKGSPALAFSPVSNRLATEGGGMIELWDIATGQKVQTFKGHFGAVVAMAFSPDGTRLATGGFDGTLRLWDATARQDYVSIPKDGVTPGEEPQLSPDGETVLTGHQSGLRRSLRLWNTATGQPRCGPIELPQAVVSQPPAWTADGRHLYVADAGKTMRVVDAASGEVVRTFPIDAETKSTGIAVSPDERWCAHPGPRGTIQVREARTGALFRTLRELEGSYLHLAFSPDGSRLMGADWDGALKIWDIAAGREVAATTLTGVGVKVARFSADGKRLAVAGASRPLLTGEVRILDAETAREVWSLKGHAITVLDVAFSPDGHRLATSSFDHTVRLWDLTTGQEILKLVDSDDVYSVRFGSNGRRLIVAAHDRRIRVWDATPLPE